MSSGKDEFRFLPSRTCIVCERVFRWQKKWSQSWHRVFCCSNECDEKAREAASGCCAEAKGLRRQERAEKD